MDLFQVANMLEGVRRKHDVEGAILERKYSSIIDRDGKDPTVPVIGVRDIDGGHLKPVLGEQFSLIPRAATDFENMGARREMADDLPNLISPNRVQMFDREHALPRRYIGRPM
jgi:hypothetical protein